MQRIYTIASDLSAQGHVILAYNRRVNMPTKHIKPVDFARRVVYSDGMMYVDGQPAKGWTVCKKP